MFTPNPAILNIGDRIELSEKLEVVTGTYEVGHKFVIIGNGERGVDLRDDNGNEVRECGLFQNTFNKVKSDTNPSSTPPTIDITITNKNLLTDLSTIRLLRRLALDAGANDKGKKATAFVEASVMFVAKYGNLIELNARQSSNG